VLRREGERKDAVSDQRKVMPDYVFGRRRDIELQSGAQLVLAGFLVTKFPKSKTLGENDRQRIGTVVDRLVSELLAGNMTEGATISMWESGVRPANAVELPIPYEVMEQWMADRTIIAVRVGSNGAGSLTLVSDDAQMRGQFPWKLVMPL
jgi:hypothetical protein